MRERYTKRKSPNNESYNNHESEGANTGDDNIIYLSKCEPEDVCWLEGDDPMQSHEPSSEENMLRNIKNESAGIPEKYIKENKNELEDYKTVASEYNFEHDTATALNNVKIEKDIDYDQSETNIIMKKTSSKYEETDETYLSHICQAEAPGQPFYLAFCCLACR